MAGFTINYTIGDTKFLWVTISTPYNDGTGRIWRGNGILDTGSSSSAISERLARELKLVSMGLKTYHGVSGEDCGDRLQNFPQNRRASALPQTPY